MTSICTIKDCVFCNQNHDVSIADNIVESAILGRMAIFSGAGVSTESRTVLPHTFYETVAEEVGLGDTSRPFPEVMDELCRQPNGRYRFLRLLQRRLETIESFPELYSVATRFHMELATLHSVGTIITTNWDTFFEDVCRSTPFISDQDLAFWDDSARRVLKIHGCVRSYGSIVATSDDYEKCELRLDRGLLGGVLKGILATQTIVFVGYSFRDGDFRTVYQFVRKQMKELLKQAYVVTPFEEDADRFRADGLIPIITSGDHFVRHLKAALVAKGAMLSDELYFNAHRLLFRVQHEHSELHAALRAADVPQQMFAAFYQDGLMHALQRVCNLRGSGEYSNACRVANLIGSYNELQKENRRRKRFDNVAYIEGYMNALIFVIDSRNGGKDEDIPLYFAFGVDKDIFTLEQFLELVPSLPSRHKSSFEFAKKSLRKLHNPSSVEMHHPPWL